MFQAWVGMAEAQKNIANSESSHDELVSIGRVLKDEREKSGLSSCDLADSLHMGREQLEALENGDRRNLPEPVFICGMLRRVSEKLGLDPVPIVQQFQSQSREKDATLSRRLMPERSAGTRSSPKRDEAAPLRRILKKAAIPVAITAITVISAMAFHANRQSTETVETKALPYPPVIEATPVSDVAPPIDVDVDPGKQKSAEISISSSQPSWVSIRNGSGEVIFEGTLSEQRHFDGDQDLEIFAGRPDLVQLSQGDKSPRALGVIDQLRWYAITPQR